jgi:hypothetical protein
MSDAGSQESITETAQHVAGGIHSAVGQASNAVCRAHGGIGEVREVIRAQPITAALVVFALGYLFGRLGSLIPGGPRRA